MVALIWALFVGLVIGGGCAALAILAGAGTPLVYLLAVVTGVLVGLVAGKPIWAKGARIEAGLKAFFGAVVAAGLLYALRSWITMPLDLTFLKLGQGPIGMNPALALPVVATALALLYEVDNMFGKDDSAGAAARKRVEGGETKARVAQPQEEPSEAGGDEGEQARGKR